MTSDRLEREREFHDKAFGEGARKSADHFYAIEAPSRTFYEEFLSQRAEGREVLEYGCGPGSLAFFLAGKGARVTGIDISPVAIEQSRAKAVEAGVAEQTRFEVMDAEDLTLESDSFDLVCGTGILHHLDLERAYGELARVLKPQGEAIFVEPLGHNPAINMYRNRTPELRTEDEHPLLTDDLDAAGRFFERSELHFFHLTTLLAVPARGRQRFDGLVKALARVDEAVFRLLPPARKQAWMVGMVLARPRAPVA